MRSLRQVQLGRDGFGNDGLDPGVRGCIGGMAREIVRSRRQDGAIEISRVGKRHGGGRVVPDRGAARLTDMGIGQVGEQLIRFPAQALDIDALKAREEAADRRRDGHGGRSRRAI